MWSLFSLYETSNWLFPSNAHFLPNVPIVLRCNSESRNRKCIQIQRRNHFQGNRPCWLCRRGSGTVSLGDTKSALSNKRRTNPVWWNHKPNLSPYLSWRVWRLLICSLDNQTKTIRILNWKKPWNSGVALLLPLTTKWSPLLLPRNSGFWKISPVSLRWLEMSDSLNFLPFFLC